MLYRLTENRKRPINSKNTKEIIFPQNRDVKKKLKANSDFHRKILDTLKVGELYRHCTDTAQNSAVPSN